VAPRRAPGASANSSSEAAADARALVEGVQRGRIVAAMALVACERGAARATVGDVVARAGVSRRTFYELFADQADCLLASIEDALARARSRVLDACDPPAPWLQRMRAGLVALLAFCEQEPVQARLLLVESLAGGPPVLARRARALAPLIAAVDAGRGQARRAEGVSALTAEATVGSVLSLLHARVLAPDGRGERGPRLLELCPQLMALIVRPYLGAAAARAELAHPAPPRSRPAPAALPPIGRLPLRLTARTLRVLAAIGQHPRSSNRRIGALAGIDDQGQMSKLLQRLKAQGLVVNESEATRRHQGAPNAWVLTARGAQLGCPLAAPR